MPWSWDTQVTAGPAEPGDSGRLRHNRRAPAPDTRTAEAIDAIRRAFLPEVESEGLLGVTAVRVVWSARTERGWLFAP